MRVDTSNLGYKYFAQSVRRTYAAEWLGLVETDQGECGALGLNHLTGAYMLYRNGCRPIELDPMQVLQALAAPVRINPPGRKAGLRGPERMRGVSLNDAVVEAARIQGNGNVSKGIRLAVEYAAMHESAFMKWAGETHNHYPTDGSP